MLIDYVRILTKERYSMTVLLVSCFAGLQWVLWPMLDPAPFILFYPAIILASLYGDGISAIVLSAFLAQFLFIPPTFSLSFASPRDIVRLTIFIISAFMIRQITIKLSTALSEAQAEREKTKEAELRLSTILSSIGDAVIATDREGRVSFMNRIAEGLTEWSLAEAKGRPLSEVFHIVNQHSREVVENPVTKVLEKGSIVGLANHTVIISRNGKEAVIEDSAAPIRVSDSRPIQGVVLVFRDVSEKYAQETMLTETYERLQQSEARMGSILENALDAVVGMDDHGRITHWNTQAERIFGYAPSEAIGMRMSEAIIPHQYRQAHEDGMERYLSTGEGPVLNRRIEITAIRRDGTEFPIELSITPIKSGERKLFAGFIRDISDQQKLKRDLLLKSDALENSLNGFDIVDEQGKFVYANKAYIEMWGYRDLVEVLQTSPVDHCADPAMPEKIIGILKDKSECDIEFTAQRKDGSTFDVHMWARLAHDSDGREVYPTTSIDITERKLAETALKESKEAAERASRAKSQFLANISHEIRTPLGAILGFSEFLLDPIQTPSDRHDCVSIIRRNADQLFRLINELLDLSKIEADRLEIEHMRFNLDEVVQDVHQLLVKQAREKGIELNFAASGLVQKSITTDPTRLRQILVNVVGNAIKFTERGGVDVSIATIQPADKNKQVQLIFTVRDSGIGLSKEQSQKIWEPFVQADSSTTRKFGGTGLGLSLSKRLACALGGDLVLVSSAPGKGSTFRITIEAGPVETLSLVSDHATSLAETRDMADKQPIQPLDGVKILVIEDSGDNQRLIKRLLIREGAAVTIASDGQEGIEKALAESYDVVLMDVQMPVLDGYTATSRLLSQGYAVPIIALTAHAMRGEREQAIAQGFFDHLTKPLDRGAMLEKITAAIQQTALQDNISLSDADDPEINAIIHEFRVNTLPEYLRSMRIAIDVSDWQQVARLAHLIKGSVGNYISPRVSVIAGQLEKEAKEGARHELLRALLSNLERLQLH